MKFAIVGAGYVAAIHARAIKKNGGEIAAVAALKKIQANSKELTEAAGKLREKSI